MSRASRVFHVLVPCICRDTQGFSRKETDFKLNRGKARSILRECIGLKAFSMKCFFYEMLRAETVFCSTRAGGLENTASGDIRVSKSFCRFSWAASFFVRILVPPARMTSDSPEAGKQREPKHRNVPLQDSNPVP